MIRGRNCSSWMTPLEIAIHRDLNTVAEILIASGCNIHCTSKWILGDTCNTIDGALRNDLHKFLQKDNIIYQHLCDNWNIPKTLKNQCRTAIHKQMKHFHDNSHIHELPLPLRLKNFINYDDVTVIVNEWRKNKKCC